MAMTTEEMQAAEARAIILDDDEESGGRAPRPFATVVARSAVALAAVLAVVGAATMFSVHSRPSSLVVGRAAGPPVISMPAASREAVFDSEETDPCTGLPFLKLMEVTHNNLGNQGPDEGEEGLFYKGENSITGQAINLHIYAKSDYVPNKASENGFHGRYGTINLKGGTEVDLEFKLFDENKNPLHVPKVDFTFFDLDTGSNGATTEYVKVKPYDKAIYQSGSELVETQYSPGFSEFKASTEGTGEDNPDDPSLLTQQQKNRAITFEFKDFHTMRATIGSTEGTLPRWFLFVARPSLLCATLKGDKDADNIVVQHGKEHTSHAPATTVATTTTEEPTTTTEEPTTTTEEPTTTTEKPKLAASQKKEEIAQCCFAFGKFICGEQKWWLWCHGR